MSNLFITGTDTDVGKTMTALCLMNALISYADKLNVSYYKPIQTGLGGGTDSEFITTHSPDEVSIVKESYLFHLPASPNRAAFAEGRVIELAKIESDFNSILSDICIVEGAGGLLVPISDDYKICDIPRVLDIPILLVASTKLGTINHTLLSIESARTNGLVIKGIVLNGPQDVGLKELIEYETGIEVVGEIPKFSNVQDGLKKSLSYFKKEFISKLVSNKSTIIEKELDSDKIWYPFTQHKIRPLCHKVIRGQGSYLYLESGEKIFDSISSWWVNIHGHAHPKIAKAIYKQALTLEHTILSGLSHDPAKMLAQKLIDLTTDSGADFSKVFFSDNGSTCVEVALKLAFQYSKNTNQNRTKFLSLKGSYHGDTCGAMSVSSPGGFHETFNELLFDVDFVAPDDFDELSKLDGVLAQKYAAFIVEPLIQGAGGMNIYSQSYLKEVRTFCSKNGILLIFDEVFTGFGRLGKMFAFEKCGVVPDIICLSKGISGGFLPISTTLVNDSIFNAFLSNEVDKAFLHGHSYTGNPLAAAASLASLEILSSVNCQSAITKIEEVTAQRILRLSKNKKIENARCIGTIGAINLKSEGDYFSSDFAYEFFEKALKKGVLLRPLGNVIYTVPPYSSTERDINLVYDVIEELLNEYK